MVLKSALSAATVLLATLTATCNAAAIQPRRDSDRPFYAIAHRCLSKADIDLAVEHKANAIETDMTAWTKWYADHDGTGHSEKATAEDLFKHIAEKKKDGANIKFVWLDIQNSDWCGKDVKDKCKMEDLMDLARENLGKNGIAVVYGFYHGTPTRTGVPYKHEVELTKDSRGFKVVRTSLRDNEAITINSNIYKDVSDDWKNKYKGNPVRKQIFDSGQVLLKSDHWERTFDELKKATLDRENVVNRVIAWTANSDDETQLRKLMDLGVDGIAYGNAEHDYSDDEYKDTVKKSRDQISKYLDDHKDQYRIHLAGENDKFV